MRRGERIAGAARRVTRIALTESARTRGSFDRRATVTLLVIALATGVLLPHVASDGFDFDHGLYRAAVTPDSPLRAALQDAPVFTVTVHDDPVRLLHAGSVDLAVDGARLVTAQSDKGDAALAAARQAAKDHTFRLMVAEADEAAAFPVRVEVAYEERAAAPGAGGARLPTDLGSGDRPRVDRTAGGTSSGGDATGGSAGSDDGASAPSSGFSFLPPERSVATPETLAPPFPFRSLILAYLFLIPMNFVVQMYAGSMIGERLNRKGEALLASPAAPWEIIAGKTLPYLLGMLGISAAIALWIGGGWLTLVAVAPLALVFLAMQFVAAMFARSFRELTFLTVFTSVLLTVYAFLPAVFTNVHPVALMSPITLAVMDIRGLPVSFGEIAYATLPLTLASGVLFMLGGALYREEDLFHQKPVLAKAVDALARQVRSVKSAFRLEILLLPLVLVGELLLITFLFAWPVPVGLLGVLLAVALVEEAFKAAPGYAAFSRGLVPPKRALAFGALAGVGFFVAEKGFLMASIVGLMDVPAGGAVLGVAGAGLPPELTGNALVLVALLFAPLVLHVVTAAISTYGASRSRGDFAAAFAAAVLIHTVYNWTVVTVMGGL